MYAHFVFNAMFAETLAKNNGQITFCDYACALSVLCRGSMADKIKWVFTLYDINKDGKCCHSIGAIQIPAGLEGSSTKGIICLARARELD